MPYGPETCHSQQGQQHRIEKVEVYRLDIPLKRPHKMSFGAPALVNIVLVRLCSGELEGWGEASVLGGPTWSEESAETIQAVVQNYLAPVVVGREFTSPNGIASAMESAVRGNQFAKAAVEMAAYDLLGKALNVPVYVLLGGKVADSLALSWSLAGDNLDQELEEAVSMKEQGVSLFKLKVGAGALEYDIKRVGKAREVLGPSIGLRVDANQAWTTHQAIRAVHALEQFDLDFVEQPVARHNLDGLAAVAQSTRVPVLVDESLFSASDAIEILKRKAAGAFGIKITKCGGFAGAKAVCGVARGAEIPCYLGCMIETSLGTSAYAHFGVSHPEINLGCELFGPLLLEGDIATPATRAVYRNGRVIVSDAPGLGVEVDMYMLKQFKVH